MFRAGNIVRRAAMEIAAGKLLLVQLDQLAGRKAFGNQSIALGRRSVAVHNR